MRPTSSGDRTPPVGFSGELMMMSLVLRRDAPLELLEVEAEAGLLAEGDRHRHPAHEVDDRLVDGEAGVRIHHLVPAVREGHDHEEHDGLGPGRDDNLVGRHRDAARLLDVLGDRLAQLGQAGRGPVVRRPRVERPLGRLADVRGGVEVRLADLEVDHGLPLALQRARPRQHLEGGLRTQPTHPLRDHGFDHGHRPSRQKTPNSRYAASGVMPLRTAPRTRFSVWRSRSRARGLLVA